MGDETRQAFQLCQPAVKLAPRPPRPELGRKRHPRACSDWLTRMPSRNFFLLKFHRLHFRDRGMSLLLHVRAPQIKQANHGPLDCATSSVNKIRPGPNFESPSVQRLCDFSARLHHSSHSILSFILSLFCRSGHLFRFSRLIFSKCVLLFILYWRWRQSFPR